MIISIVPTIQVENVQEALKQTAEWMKEGFEGSILKDFDNIFLTHTSPTQLKLKVAFTVDVRVVGFVEGKRGTKREKTFGSIRYETDDKQIVGSVSGFNDRELKTINDNRDYYIGKIIEIEANDLTKARGSDTFALSHPRFVCLREDKLNSDNLDRVMLSLDSAKGLK